MRIGNAAQGDIAPHAGLFISGRPMLDARAPVEFIKGAFPTATNLPLMNDQDREQVGLCYKQHGQEAAIALGHKLVSGEVKAARIAQWAEFARTNPDGCLYCFRGGLRSKITQQWLKTEAGIDYPRIAGGYKAMRGFLMEAIDAAAKPDQLIVIGGMTGTGKTDVLLQLDNSLDLEGYAHHRGSSFGKRATPQPATIDFEHRLAIDILRRRADGHRWFALEDESRLIGRCALPLPLHEAMQRAHMVWLEDSFENRVERLLRDYVTGLHAEYCLLDREQGFVRFREHLQQALGNLVKRLGDERYRRLLALMQAAMAQQEKDATVDLHREWIAGLLREYYDPLYAYQRETKGPRLVFAGEQTGVLDFLRHRAES